MKKIIQIALVVLLATACGQKKKTEKTEGTTGDFMFHKVIVDEVIQTTGYTYLNVTEKGDNYWVAVSKDDYMPGEELFYFEASVTTMEDFHSKELNRDFDKILFLSQVSKDKNKVSPHQTNPAMGSTAHSGRKEATENDAISVEKAAGGITIADLYEHKTDYANKKVKIRGVVVKVNNQIMGRNWVHIQDGTKYQDDYDLTVTTQATVQMNDKITVEGVVGIDKDFTSGYFYPVIVESANVINE